MGFEKYGVQFPALRQMRLYQYNCSVCLKPVFRDIRRVHESEKRNWKVYCSTKCLSKAKNKSQKFSCANPLCEKLVYRSPNEISASGRIFCSKSCTAIVCNSERKRRKNTLKQKTFNPKKNFKKCLNPECKNLIPLTNKYCSNACQGKIVKIPGSEYKKRVVKAISNFYRNYGRIPLKRELPTQYRPARRAFGSWNDAIKSAGFNPNPVLFANKHTANDGHQCDSLAEKIIDDWFFARNIPHNIHVPYPNTKMSADFEVNGKLIEFLGLKGELKRYDELLIQKERLWKDQNLNVIKVYPNDLFPKNRLNTVLSSL